MHEKKLDYAGLKRVAPSPFDFNQYECHPLEEMVGKVTVGSNASQDLIKAFARGMRPHTILAN